MFLPAWVRQPGTQQSGKAALAGAPMQRRMSRILAILSLTILSGCATGMLGRLEEEKRAEQQQAAAVQIADRSGMTFDALSNHLRECRKLRYVPNAYIDAVTDEVTARAPWPPEVKKIVSQRQIRIGFTE